MTAEETTGIEEVDQAPTDAPGGRPARMRRLVRGRVIPGLWVFAVVASLGLFLGLGWRLWWPDQQVDSDAAQSAMSAAADGTLAVLSYSSKTFDSDVSSARTHLTGDFLSQYNNYIRESIEPIAKTKAIQTNATVIRKAVSDLQPDSAQVLLYINQATRTTENPAPAMAATSVLVKLVKVDGKWLISKFDPV